jgi:hypothetical protein
MQDSSELDRLRIMRDRNVRRRPDGGSVLLTLDFITKRINFAVSDKHRVAWCSFH